MPQRTASPSDAPARRADDREVLQALARLLADAALDELPGRRVERRLARAEEEAAANGPRGCRGRRRRARRRRVTG